MNVYRINIWLGLIGVVVALGAGGCSDLRSSAPDSGVTVDRGDGGDRPATPGDGASVAPDAGGSDTAADVGGGAEVSAPDPVDAGDGPPLACELGQQRCGVNQTPETCAAGGVWMAAEACPFVCTGAGVCGGSCVPASKRCAGQNNLTIETCDQSGAWGTGERCANLCSSGSCAGSCMPGTRRCGANQIPETCSAMGTWEPGTACDHVCTGAGVCGGECKPGDRGCAGNRPRVCGSAGIWQDEAPCQFICSGRGQCTGQCVPGTRDCNGRVGGTVRFCNAGAWQNERTCEFICAGAACTGDCRPGAKSCSGRTPRTCDDNGGWTSGSACQYSCAGAGQCTSCDPGTTRRCSGDGARVEVCSADGSGFTNQQGCPSGCNAERLACNTCRPGAHSSCSNGQRSTCRADGTGFGAAACDAACNAQTCSGACVVRAANFCVIADGMTPGSVSETCEMHRNGTACDGDPSNEPCDRDAPNNRIYMWVYRQAEPGRYELLATKYWVCDVDGRWGEGS